MPKTAVNPWTASVCLNKVSQLPQTPYYSRNECFYSFIWKTVFVSSASFMLHDNYAALRDFGPYLHNSIPQLLHICEVTPLFNHLPKVLCYRGHLSAVNYRLKWSDHCDICIFLLEVFNRIWVPCDRKGMDIVSNNSQVGCGIQTMLRCF